MHEKNYDARDYFKIISGLRIGGGTGYTTAELQFHAFIISPFFKTLF